jgi:hypothetical protein
MTEKQHGLYRSVSLFLTVKHRMVVCLIIFCSMFVFGEDWPKEVLQFKPFAKDDKLVYVERKTGRTTIGYFYRNSVDEKSLLYSNEPYLKDGPYYFSKDKKTAFLLCKNKDGYADFPDYFDYSLYIVDGEKGRVAKICNTSSTVAISSDCEYTIFQDYKYLLQKLDEKKKAISKILVISNSDLKVVATFNIAGDILSRKGVNGFEWLPEKKGFLFVILRDDGYWETYVIDTDKRKLDFVSVSDQPKWE